jgi:hypothetical protein
MLGEVYPDVSEELGAFGVWKGYLSIVDGSIMFETRRHSVALPEELIRQKSKVKEFR